MSAAPRPSQWYFTVRSKGSACTSYLEALTQYYMPSHIALSSSIKDEMVSFSEASKYALIDELLMFEITRVDSLEPMRFINAFVNYKAIPTHLNAVRATCFFTLDESLLILHGDSRVASFSDFMVTVPGFAAVLRRDMDGAALAGMLDPRPVPAVTRLPQMMEKELSRGKFVLHRTMADHNFTSKMEHFCDGNNVSEDAVFTAIIAAVLKDMFELPRVPINVVDDESIAELSLRPGPVSVASITALSRTATKMLKVERKPATIRIEVESGTAAVVRMLESTRSRAPVTDVYAGILVSGAISATLTRVDNNIYLSVASDVLSEEQAMALAKLTIDNAMGVFQGSVGDIEGAL
ncbi:hypothetical protein J8273_2898 [Carpediemonas membranifera]|uniref:Uncharacterized protein n=1 Tax=Carpediemonas membranifera TaxID=201153 RepID=A0A8J6E0Z1_9EUKA|nr:hypothetical protein J8273_2898 [Carpediemonas membranifera]|eukprot:KAG9395694.1 hypothetical protein J8273_2898 [Carpediemonas membranifera]